MKTTIIIILLFIGLRIDAQSESNLDRPRIYEADSLIKIAQVHGISALKRIIDPIDLIYVDSSYANQIIDLEFKTGLWGKHYDNNNVTVYYTPDLTLQIADKFCNKEAAKRLFEYYCNLPKVSRSDTLYNIFWCLDDYFKVLIKYNSKQLISKLIGDFNEWTKIEQNTPKKIYPTKAQMMRRSFEESMKFNASDLIIDCNYILLQIAEMLNYLKVPSFDQSLIEKVKANQTWPFASGHTLYVPDEILSKCKFIKSKTLDNYLKIKDYKTDYKKLETIILKNFENCCGSRIFQIIEKGSTAYVTMTRNNGSDFYVVSIESNKKIIIDLVSLIIE